MKSRFTIKERQQEKVLLAESGKEALLLAGMPNGEIVRIEDVGPNGYWKVVFDAWTPANIWI